MVTEIHYGPGSVVVFTMEYGEEPDLVALNPALQTMDHPVFHRYDDGSSTVVWLIAAYALTGEEQALVYTAYQGVL